MEEKGMKNGEITIYGKISETYADTPLNLYRYRVAVAKLYRYSLNLYLYSLNLYRYSLNLYQYNLQELNLYRYS